MIESGYGRISVIFLTFHLLYLCHVDLMTSELSNLKSWNVARHHHVVVWTAFNNNLGLIGGRSNFISGFKVNCIFQLPTISCDLKGDGGKQSPGLNWLKNLCFYKAAPFAHQ